MSAAAAALSALLAIQPIQVTGYTLPGFMANGRPVHPGAAACPIEIPFDTLIQIDGIGVVDCEDRYAPWLSPRFDVWVPTVAQAKNLTGRYAWEIVEPMNPCGLACNEGSTNG